MSLMHRRAPTRGTGESISGGFIDRRAQIAAPGDTRHTEKQRAIDYGRANWKIDGPLGYTAMLPLLIA